MGKPKVNLTKSVLYITWFYIVFTSASRQTPSRKISEASQRQSSVEKAATLHESAHSSSDRDILPPLPMVAQNSTVSIEPPVSHEQNTSKNQVGRRLFSNLRLTVGILNPIFGISIQITVKARVGDEMLGYVTCASLSDDGLLSRN